MRREIDTIFAWQGYFENSAWEDPFLSHETEQKCSLETTQIPIMNPITTQDPAVKNPAPTQCATTMNCSFCKSIKAVLNPVWPQVQISNQITVYVLFQNFKFQTQLLRTSNLLWSVFTILKFEPIICYALFVIWLVNYFIVITDVILNHVRIHLWKDI